MFQISLILFLIHKSEALLTNEYDLISNMTIKIVQNINGTPKIIQTYKYIGL